MMQWRSFHVRLSLWNVAVLAAILAAFVGVLGHIQSRNLSVTVDRELERRARPFNQPGHPLPPPLARFNPGMPGPQPPFDAPRELQPFDGPRFQGPGDFQGYAPRPRPQWPEDPESMRAAAFTRPRFFTPDGSVAGPPDVSEPWERGGLDVALAGGEHFSTATVEGERVRIFSMPLSRGGQTIGALQLAQPLGPFQRLGERQTAGLLFLTPLALIAAGAGGVFLTTRALRPIREMTRTAEKISAEDLTQRLAVEGEDELAQLARTFNAMVARLEVAFEQQRRFTADASHELRTPLARLKVTTSEVLEGDRSSEEYRRALRIADESVDGMSRLVQELLILARSDAGQLSARTQLLDLALLARDVAADWEDAGPSLEVQLPNRPLVIRGNGDNLRRAVGNLLENAVRHTPPEGRITVRADATADRAVLLIHDTGGGIAAEHLPHLGERFYRVDASRTRDTPGVGGGSGLGLAICRSVVEGHGGTLHINSIEGRGTAVTLTFPLAEHVATPSLPA
jgi:two-component system, OmpR family, sensor kinase